jgi:hypothetical protein
VVPTGGPSAKDGGLIRDVPGDSGGSRPDGAAAGLGLEAARGGEDGAPLAPGEFCVPPGLGGFQVSCAVSSV